MMSTLSDLTRVPGGSFLQRHLLDDEVVPTGETKRLARIAGRCHGDAGSLRVPVSRGRGARRHLGVVARGAMTAAHLGG